ncbi:MAG: polyprenyl synthetase family protein [Chloroflexi bacterium]|nr:polyprenyl synthetase family protein [Chloroflexota bacterium]
MVTNKIDEGMQAIEETLHTIVNSDVDVLQEASRHIIASGGKRVRPRLALLAYLAAGGQALAEAVPMAAALEMVHTATLVHDDINDHSPTRRGKVTVHARWGNTFALLTGDYLFTKVYELMAPYGRPYNSIMSNACIQLVEGETLQAAAAKTGVMDRETYKTIIAKKTASLFEAGANMGARLAGADEEIIEALTIYAYNLGLTFQIVDDILDIVGDPETMGKPVGADLVQGRGVMAAQNGEKLATHADGDRIATAVAEADPVQQMMEHLRNSGAVEVARMQAAEMAQRARTALDKVPPSSTRDDLASLIDLILNRDK